jgi:hypothetical protein
MAEGARKKPAPDLGFVPFNVDSVPICWRGAVTPEPLTVRSAVLEAHRRRTRSSVATHLPVFADESR